jgi:FMNH2-dependent dimethyl sulfone monooxygenase
LWREQKFSYSGHYYRIETAILEPKPISRPRPTIYAGGESEAAKTLIAQQADAYVMHGDDPERIARKVEDLSLRRERTGLPPMTFGVAGYTIVRDSAGEARAELARITDVKQSAAGYENYQQWIANTQLDQRVSLEDYSVSNRGLRSGLIGTPEQVLDRVRAFEAAGVDLLLLQCSPQLEEMERFGREVIAPYRQKQSAVAAMTSPALAEGATRW